MDQPFSAGRIISNGFAIAAKNAHVMLPLAVILFLPLIIYTVWLLDNLTVKNAETYDWLSSLISLPMGGLLTAILLHATISSLKGESIEIMTSIKVGLKRVLPVILTSIVVGLCTGLATLLLIIPGLIVMCYLWVALPSVVIEGTSVTDAMSRSAQLTEGYRWQIFGIAMLSGGLMIVAGVLLGVLMAKGSIGVETVLYLSVGLQIVISVLSAVFAGATYYELRRVKEGLELDDLAAAFD